VGTGSLGAAGAAVGLAVGATLAAHGPIAGLSDALTATVDGLPLSIDGALGVSRAAGVMGSLVLIGLLLGTRWGPAHRNDTWPWPLAGAALGVVGVLAWVTGSRAGWGWGLSITGPSRSLIESTVLGRPAAVNWGTMMLVGVPLGAWLSARARGPVAWRRRPWPEIGQRLAGGLLMGFGGTLAAGCNIGNALTGLSVLALNSALATAGIVGGTAVAVAAPGIRRLIPGFTFVRQKP